MDEGDRMQESEVMGNGALVDNGTGQVPTDEWTAAALAHASVLLTLILGMAGGIGAPVGLAVPLVMYFGYRRDSRYIAFHSLQAFVYQVAGIIGIARNEGAPSGNFDIQRHILIFETKANPKR